MRVVNEKQEQAYRLCHHDFDGMTAREAAVVMGITPQHVWRLLAELKKIAPQLFPILTRMQAMLWDLWYDQGISCDSIAKLQNKNVVTVMNSLEAIKRKIGYKPELHERGTLLSYELLTKDQRATIKRKF